jgi:SAM-dependent methyltransferase
MSHDDETVDRHLYDGVARLQERLGADAVDRLRPTIEGDNGEARFTELVQQHVGVEDVVVDIGTGDGTWLLRNVAPRVRRAIGLDYARGRFRTALRVREELGATNVDFLLADGRRIPLRDNIATTITSRRAPWTADEEFFAEGCRLLAPGGLGLEIGIGAENGKELDAAFGERSQMHAWQASGRNTLDEQIALFRRYGLEPFVTESYLAMEVFPSREALVFRLETSPAVDGFDPKADAALVDLVIDASGLRMTTHRFCLLAKKTT